MADCGTPRRVLQDLPVNRFGTSKPLDLSSAVEAKVKRSISEVEDPAVAPVPSRLRTSISEENKSLPVLQFIRSVDLYADKKRSLLQPQP